LGKWNEKPELWKLAEQEGWKVNMKRARSHPALATVLCNFGRSGNKKSIFPVLARGLRTESESERNLSASVVRVTLRRRAS
jgi:hypothetical protein